MTRAAFIEQNIGLVHTCAHRFKGRGIEYDDLFQAGCVGLVKATDAFDTGRGVRFSTYAVPVIIGEMRRLFRDGGPVKISRSLKELAVRVARARERLEALSSEDVSIERLARELDADPETVVEALGAGLPPLSLTESEENGGGQLDVPTPSPEAALTDVLALRQSLAGCEPRDRALLLLRYRACLTQAETARRLGMTQVQVSRREKKLLLALRGDLVG